MKKDKRTTRSGKCVPISRVRKYAAGIFISCLGLVSTVPYLIGELLKAGSLVDFLQSFIQPPRIFPHIMMLLSIPAFMLIGYFYQKQKNLAENLEHIIEERTEWLLRSQTRLENVFSASPDAITVSDLNGNLIDCNQATLDMHGYSSKKELIGKNALKLIAKKDHKRAMKNLKKTLEQGSVKNIEYTFLTKHGREFLAELSVSVIKDRSGKPTGFVAITKDITERKNAERALRVSEEKFRNIFDSANDSMTYLDRSGRILDVNKKAVQLFGGSREELLGKHYMRVGIFSPRDIPVLMSKFANILAGKKPILNISIKNKKGKEIPLECSSSLMKTDGKLVGIMVIARDVTERKKMEDKLKEYTEHLEEKVEERARELKEAQKQLLKSERLAAIGELATMVGHDLRNPLQSIKNATYYLTNELSRLPASVQIPQKAMEMLQIINDSVNYADKIIRDLQDFSATKKPTLKKTDVNAIVMEALSQVEMPENVELITELDHLPEIKADKDMIKRVFMNLASNGIQAMENGGRLKISTKKQKTLLKFVSKTQA